MPAGIECSLRVSRGTVELRDSTGKVVGKTVENDYAGREIFAFKATGEKTEIWGFRAPAGGGTRVMRFYAPLNGIWADVPGLLPRMEANPPEIEEAAFEMKSIGFIATNLLPKALFGNGPFGEGYELKGAAALHGTTPDERCDPARGGQRCLQVAFFERNGESLRFYWCSDGRENERPGFDLLTLNVPEPIEIPVWINTRTGEVCTIEERNSVRDGDKQILRNVPVRMTPIIICDRSCFEISENVSRYLLVVSG